MNIIKCARLKAGLTQQQLASRAGISQPAVARIESDRVSPRLETVNRLLRACGMHLEAVERGGVGIDRTVIRQMLTLSPADRLRIATKEARNLALLEPQ